MSGYDYDEAYLKSLSHFSSLERTVSWRQSSILGRRQGGERHGYNCDDLIPFLCEMFALPYDGARSYRPKIELLSSRDRYVIVRGLLLLIEL